MIKSTLILNTILFMFDDFQNRLDESYIDNYLNFKRSI